jgi:hypothetical protein
VAEGAKMGSRGSRPVYRDERERGVIGEYANAQMRDGESEGEGEGEGGYGL